jgi:hypothetical protein
MSSDWSFPTAEVESRLINYSQQRPLRITRIATPQPPFFCATVISPYSARREAPMAIDCLELTASAGERLEVRVTADPADYLSREEKVAAPGAPVLIDSAGPAEQAFGRGAEVVAWCISQHVDFIQLLSAVASFPPPDSSSVPVLVTWPPQRGIVEASCIDAGRSGSTWGIFVPVVFPLTTSLSFLERLALAAQSNGASFLASGSLEIEPAAKKVVAEIAGDDPDVYDTLFHSDLETLHTTTERHLAALAHERGMADHILLPRSGERTNWNAAALLARTASRMIRMGEEVEEAWSIQRSSQIVAGLDKPLHIVAASARLSIIRGLDPVSVETLEQWLAGQEPAFVRAVDERWRVRRL